MGSHSRKETVVVTGGAGGIGVCLGREFGNTGARVVLADVDGARLAQRAGELRGEGIEVHTQIVDVTRPAQVTAFIDGVCARFGALDVLINNAGVGHHGPLAATSLEQWRLLFDVNFWGPLYHVYAALPHLRRAGGGTIVNISSGQAFFRLPTWGAYAAAKAALGVFSEVLHFELRREGIRVLTVYPFMVDTPFYRDISGQTRIGKLSMRLVPLYSMAPERVARIVKRAVKHGHRVETVSVWNRVAQVGRIVPGWSTVVGRLGSRLLLGRE